MKNSPKISVVIPAYNEEKYLPNLLSSLKSQSFRDFEIIVVDNNSTDKTAKIARSFGAKVVKEKIKGMTPAREKGFSSAKAEIIARTDADSTVSKNWLETIYQAFQNLPNSCALTGSFTFPSVGKPIALFLRLFTNLCYYKFSKLLMGHYPLSGPNYAVRKSCWKKIKNQIHRDDSMVHEDMDLSCHLAEIGQITFLPQMIVSYSLRRWRMNFFYTAFEYLFRYFRTIFIHHSFFS